MIIKYMKKNWKISTFNNIAMKKLIYALSALLLAVSLNSCDTEIKNAGSKDLIGTWDLVSTTVVLGDGTETTTKSTTKKTTKK